SRFAQSARGPRALFRQPDFGAMPSVLKRGRTLAAVAVPRRGADEVVAGELVVARHFDRIEAPNPHPLQRVTGELIRREFLVLRRDAGTGGIEVAMRLM